MRAISSQGVDLENIREYWQIHAAMSDLLLSGDNRLSLICYYLVIIEILGNMKGMVVLYLNLLLLTRMLLQCVLVITRLVPIKIAQTN